MTKTNPAPRSDIGNKALPIVFASGGLLILLASLMVCAGVWRFTQAAVAVPGTVTRLNAGGSHPEVQFATLEGKVLRYPQGGLISGYAVGDKVTVLYDRNNPPDATLDTWGALWGFPLGGTVMGLAFISIAILKRARPDLVS